MALFMSLLWASVVRRCVVGVAAAGLWAATKPARAADKIQFSDESPRIRLPVAPRQDRPAREEFEFLNRKSSVSGVVGTPITRLPPPAPVLRDQKALQEYFDRRDWIFNATLTEGRTNQVEELFADDAEGYEESEQPVKRGVERYLERQEQNREARLEKLRQDRQRRVEDDAADSRDLPPNPFDAEARRPAGTDATFTFGGDGSGWFGARAKTQEEEPAGGSSFPGLRDHLKGFSLKPQTAPPERQSQTEDLKRLLDLPSSITPIKGTLDLLNLQPDLTQQALNPLTSPALKDLPGRPEKTDSLDVLRLYRPEPRLPAARPLDDLKPKTLGESSLSPAVVAPPEPPAPKPKHNLLEIPRRSF